MKDFKFLVEQISEVHTSLHRYAVNAINKSLTVRNWLIGYYIVEYEQNGEDRAVYGAGLLSSIADKIQIKGLTAPELSRCRQFYNCYPRILGTASQELNKLLPPAILGTLSQELVNEDVNQLISRLSYSHISQLIKIKDPLKRSFYEVECIKGTWSVRELKRQISSLYFERSGMSQSPEKLSSLTQSQTTPQEATDIVKNVYAFEFLGLSRYEAIEESDLEQALLDNLQAFITELGNGFCFEARQKKILIGENYYFIDLVFYHRILKCHVIIELKVGAFDHGDIGQLNTYLNFYKAEISEKNDNHPIGILLVADKDHALVKYATAGMDQHLFVQQYMVKLPSKEQLETYINKELHKLR